MPRTMAPQITRSYRGRLKDAQKSMDKDAREFAKQGYSLAAEAWESESDAKQSKHKSHGILWKLTHPVGATLGAARFVGAAAISSLSPNDKGTLTATFERPAGQGDG